MTTGDAVADGLVSARHSPRTFVPSSRAARLDRMSGMTASVAARADEARTGDAGCALRGDHGNHQDPHFPAEGQAAYCGLGEKQGRQRQRKCWCRQVEAVAGGTTRPTTDFRRRAAPSCASVRAGRFPTSWCRARSAARPDVAEEAQDREAGEPRVLPSTSSTNRVLVRQKAAISAPRLTSELMPYWLMVKAIAPNADRCGAHDDADDAEEHRRRCRYPDFLAHHPAADGEAGQDRDQQNPQQVARCERAEIGSGGMIAVMGD